MTHEDFLNHILASSCSNSSEDYEGYYEYTIELHCEVFTIVAKCVQREPTFKYEIKCMKDQYGKVWE